VERDAEARLQEALDSLSVEDPKALARWNQANPGNRWIEERRRATAREILASLPSASRAVLDVGCGDGDVLSTVATDVRGVKIGVDVAHQNLVHGVKTHRTLRFAQSDARMLPFAAESFDLVLAFMLFSSIPDNATASAAAAEIDRVLCPGGLVLWYDYWIGNPWNPYTRGRGVRAIKMLFPSYTYRVRRITVLPQLARRLGSLTDFLYPRLARLPFMLTHRIGLIEKPSDA